MLEDAAGIRRVVLACGTVDLRKGIDGLATIIGDRYGQNPFEKGTLFLFCGKRSDRCKGLLWMGTGFLLLYKRLANQQRFGRRTEKLDDIAGQLSFFNEAEANYDETAPEPVMEEVIESAKKRSRKSKKKGQREEDLKDFPQEEISHDIPEQELNEAFGSGNWKSMPDEVFWQLRFEPARWIAEKHVIKVYVGTDGTHQDEFLRGDHPETLFKGSIATPSLEAAIINSKYVNSNPLDRISRDFGVNGLNLSKQTMSNWTVWTAESYLSVVYEMMKQCQLKAHVNQCDETTVDVIHDGRPAGSKSYMCYVLSF